MAPDSSQLKRKPRENQYIFDLGVRGRKTGLTVEDTGIRDENGLEPMDHLFSSPEKSTRKANRNGRNANTTISSEEDMELVESSLPEYETGRKRTGMRMPLPHSRSPKKTFLQSPARRNPSLGPLSSPSRGSIIVPQGPPESISVRRRLDFSNENFEGSMADTGAKGRSSQKGEDVRATIRAGRGKAVQPTSMKSPNQDDGSYDEYDDPQAQYDENEEDPNQIMEGGDDEVDQVESEAEPEPEPPKKSKGKGKAKEPEAKPSEAKKGRGKKKRDSNVAGLDESAAPTKKTRRSLESAKVTTTGQSRNTATKELKAKTAPAKGRKPKTAKTNLAPIAENDSPAVQRGPPMPRNNRGLIILRRETPMDSDGFKTTRSGRNSVRPVQFWKNERIEYSDDENEHNGGDKFLLPRVKGVVRVDEVEEPRKRRQYHKSNKGKKRPVAVESEEEDEIEPWEMNPGRLVGEIRIWDPEDQTGMHAEEAEEEIALSSTAIVMKDTAGTFKFAKTLSTPFFATGMVDLPPGAEKKPKNSRKMQMVFFVFYGRVEVTVNDNKFRIGKGGMWQVPRGNFYSITNDYENPARIFFAQGCEVMEDATGDIALPVQ